MKIIAGPCSIDQDNKLEVLEYAKLKYNNKNALFGVRVVGLKSRTNYDPLNAFIGIDLDLYNKNCENLIDGNNDFLIHPSVKIANEIQASNPDLYIATEIVDSWVQPLNLAKYLHSNKVIIWNPAVNHLGFPIQVMSRIASKNKWIIGIKNGKTLGSSYEDSEINNKQSSLEKSWAGLASYANFNDKKDVFFIHRGVDLGDNKGFRNTPVHELCKRVKISTNQEIFLDPSHILGPKKRDEIIDFTIDALKIKFDNGFLYDGVLIETGTSKSDTEQHITPHELERLISEVTKFRAL